MRVAQFGHQVTLARNGCEALELMRSGLYRLVVSDWEMPEMTGIELCRRIRQRFASGYVYIILLTARRGTQNIVEGLNAGADDFVSKPFEPQELVVRDSRGRAHPVAGKPGTDDLQPGKTGRIARHRRPARTWSACGQYCRVLADHLSHQAEISATKSTATTCN